MKLLNLPIAHIYVLRVDKTDHVPVHVVANCAHFGFGMTYQAGELLGKFYNQPEAVDWINRREFHRTRSLMAVD